MMLIANTIVGWSFIIFGINTFVKTLSHANSEDYSNPITVMNGKDIVLTCGLNEDHIAYMMSSSTKWFFKACQSRMKQLVCEDSPNVPWVELNCGTEPCKPVLEIKNTTVNNTGLYRCTVYPYKPSQYTTLNIQLVKTHHVHVLNFTLSAPEFLENFPTNITAESGSQVVLQCKVFSVDHLAIRWFRRKDVHNDMVLDNDFMRSRLIQHFENIYEPIDSGGQKELAEDIYLSKLIINDVTESNTGQFVCVAINYWGYNIREVNLNVLTPYFVTTVDQVDIQKYFLLLLMPLSLLVLPLILFIFCICIRKSRDSRIMTKQVDNFDHIYMNKNII